MVARTEGRNRKNIYEEKHKISIHLVFPSRKEEVISVEMLSNRCFCRLANNLFPFCGNATNRLMVIIFNDRIEIINIGKRQKRRKEQRYQDQFPRDELFFSQILFFFCISIISIQTISIHENFSFRHEMSMLRFTLFFFVLFFSPFWYIFVVVVVIVK